MWRPVFTSSVFWRAGHILACLLTDWLQRLTVIGYHLACDGCKKKPYNGALNGVYSGPFMSWTPKAKKEKKKTEVFNNLFGILSVVAYLQSMNSKRLETDKQLFNRFYLKYLAYYIKQLVGDF